MAATADKVGEARSSDIIDCRCHCGSFRATLSVGSHRQRRRAVCYCQDCQAFQRALGSEDAVLDAHGGSDILMVSPAALLINAGHDMLVPLRLSPNGLLRWYTHCCETPIGNTPAKRLLPHLGMLTHGVVAGRDETALAGSNAEAVAAVDATFGAPTERLFGRDALGAPPAGAHQGVPLSMVPPVAFALLSRLVRGDHRRSPFFDAVGRPVASPRVLSESERAALAPSPDRDHDPAD